MRILSQNGYNLVETSLVTKHFSNVTCIAKGCDCEILLASCENEEQAKRVIKEISKLVYEERVINMKELLESLKDKDNNNANIENKTSIYENAFQKAILMQKANVENNK